jgi:hypothetical protein
MTEMRHEAEVDSRIAAAHGVYSKAYSNLSWWRKHTTGFQAEQKLADATEEFESAKAALLEVESEYTGWSRFFLVTNNGGHIHRSMNCSTCYPSTGYAWLPELSGLSEADAVAEYGSILCSICYPSAPVEWTNGVNKKEAERKDAEKALKAIAASPEGKKVKSATELVQRKLYRIERAERDLARLADDRRHEAESAPWLLRDCERHEAELPKYRKQLAAAERKLEAAEAALAAALGV